MCTKKKLLYKKATSSNSDVAWQKFKECSNKALIRKSHKDYTYDISLNAKRYPKKFWSYVASKRKFSDCDSFNINGSVVSNPTEISDAFNKRFCSKLDGTYSPLDLGSLRDTPTSHGAPPLCFNLFTVDKVLETLKNLDVSKSPGPDEIVPLFLKSCCNEFVPYYVISLTSSFRKVKFQRLGNKQMWFLFFIKVVSSQRMMLVVTALSH